MSWDAYVTNLEGYPGVTHAALMGKDGSKWASTSGFEPSAQEVTALVNATTTPPSFHLAGQKYLTLRKEEDFIDGKLKGYVASVAIGNSCVVIALHRPAAGKEDEETPGMGQKLNTAANKIKDFLLQQGY